MTDDANPEAAVAISGDKNLPPEIFAALQDRLEQYYMKWVDFSIPALMGMTPRQAAKDPSMRTALLALLQEMEHRGDLIEQSTKLSAGPKPDTAAIRAVLFGDAVN